MKDLKALAKEFSEKIEECTMFYEGVHTKNYYSVIGYDKKDYLAVTFSESQILVEHTTKRPFEIVEILKEIEPKAKISYCREIKTYETLTI